MNILKNVKQLIDKRAALQTAIDKIDAILAPFGKVDLGDFKTKAAKSSGGLRVRKPFSAAVKAKMSIAAKARWKKAKAAGKTRL